MSNHVAFSFFRKRNRALSCFVGQPNDSHYSVALKTTSLFTCLVALFSDRQSRCLCKTMSQKLCGNEVAVAAVFRWFSNWNLVNSLSFFFMRVSKNKWNCTVSDQFFFTSFWSYAYSLLKCTIRHKMQLWSNSKVIVCWFVNQVHIISLVILILFILVGQCLSQSTNGRVGLL